MSSHHRGFPRTIEKAPTQYVGVFPFSNLAVRAFASGHVRAARRSAFPEDRAEYASGDPFCAIHSAKLLQLALIEPDPAALAALIDPYLLGVALFEVGAAAGAFVVVRLALCFFSLGVELHPHLVNDLEILFGEVLVFVLARLLVDGHRLLASPYGKYTTLRAS